MHTFQENNLATQTESENSSGRTATQSFYLRRYFENSRRRSWFLSCAAGTTAQILAHLHASVNIIPPLANGINSN